VPVGRCPGPVTHTQEDCAAAYKSGRIISSSVLFNRCFFCCSIKPARKRANKTGFPYRLTTKSYTSAYDRIILSELTFQMIIVLGMGTVSLKRLSRFDTWPSMVGQAGLPSARRPHSGLRAVASEREIPTKEGTTAGSPNPRACLVPKKPLRNVPHHLRMVGYVVLFRYLAQHALAWGARRACSRPRMTDEGGNSWFPAPVAHDLA